MILVLLSEILLHIPNMEGFPLGLITLILDHLEHGAIGSSDPSISRHISMSSACVTYWDFRAGFTSTSALVAPCSTIRFGRRKLNVPQFREQSWKVR